MEKKIANAFLHKLLRERFDRITNYYNDEIEACIITAKFFGLTELATEMENDLKI